MNESVLEVYQLFQKNRKLSIDSRTIEQGSIYVALKGENHDGHQFVESALDKGAIIAVVDNDKYSLPEKTVLVEDSLAFLQELAQFHRRQFSFPVFAITGTNGKTTTKELCLAVMETQYKVMATQGNLNNHIGVPLTLLSFPTDLDFGIVEMGANHLGEIADLCRIAEPNFGLITNVGKAHLEGFGSFEGVVKAKTELYSFIQQKKGKVFLNGDNSLLVENARDIQSIRYGILKDNFLQAKLIDNNPFLEFSIISSDRETLIKTQLIGSYNFENAMAASCLGSYFQIPIEKIKQGIESYSPQNIRSQFVVTEDNKVILDTYNANPSSMMVALNNFMQIEAESKIVILGDMFELGRESEKEHQKIVDFLVQNKIEAILVGEEFMKTSASYPCFPSVSLLEQTLIRKPIVNHLVLVKASRGIKLEKVIDSL